MLEKRLLAEGGLGIISNLCSMLPHMVLKGLPLLVS